MTAALILPRLPRGRPTSSTLAAYDVELQRFCGLILEINSLISGCRPEAGATSSKITASTKVSSTTLKGRRFRVAYGSRRRS